MIQYFDTAARGPKIASFSQIIFYDDQKTVILVLRQGSEHISSLILKSVR